MLVNEDNYQRLHQLHLFDLQNLEAQWHFSQSIHISCFKF